MTEQLSFIPTNIVNACHILRIKRPSKDIYVDYLKNINPIKDVENLEEYKLLHSIDVNSILNIKEIRSFPFISSINSIPKDVFNTICDNVIEEMLSPKDIEFTSFRDSLYDILTYNLDMAECLWYILTYLIEKNYLKNEDISDIIVRSYSFLKYYNNNYRPIYHLESIIFYIINKLHSYNEV
jgi:hypothetical protein